MVATHYLRSDGTLKAIADMHPNHVQKALAKLERDEPHRTEEIAAMRADQLVRPPEP
jgi:hypothetical protein